MPAKMHVAVLALTVVLSCIAFPCPASAAEPPCAALKDASRSELAAYLKGERASLDTACILYAIRELGKEPDATAAAALAGVLDFAEPGYKESHPWIEGRAMPDIFGEYPAFHILEKIGPAAAPELIRVIGDFEISDRLRENALLVLTLVLGGRSAAAPVALVTAARAVEATDPPRAARLLRAGRERARRCIQSLLLNVGIPSADEERKRCEDVLYQ
jgi:hypothetical protein